MLAPGLPRDMPLRPLVSPCSLLLNLSVPFLVGATQAPIQRVNINCFRYHNNKVPSVGIIQVDRRPHMGPSLIGADRPQRPVSKEAARVCCRSRNVRKVRWSCARRYLFFFFNQCGRPHYRRQSPVTVMYGPSPPKSIYTAVAVVAGDHVAAVVIADLFVHRLVIVRLAVGY